MHLIHLTVAGPTDEGWRAIADDGTERHLPRTALHGHLVTLRAGQRVWAEVSGDVPPTILRVGIGPAPTAG